MANWRALLAVVAAIGAASIAAAAVAQQQRATEVDVELVLAVDISRSMDRDEHTLQREGYIKAFRSRDVIGAIATGKKKRIAVVYIEWAGDLSPSHTLPWTIIDGEASARAFADHLAAQPIFGEQRTSISTALYEAARSIENNNIASERQIINLSGDGANAVGPPVEKARDEIIERGIVINGLPIMLNKPREYYDVEQLDRYYEHCVIGGRGAFVLPLARVEDLAEATRKAIAAPVIVPSAGGANQSPVDCLAGEKAWAANPQQRN